LTSFDVGLTHLVDLKCAACQCASLNLTMGIDFLNSKTEELVSRLTPLNSLEWEFMRK